MKKHELKQAITKRAELGKCLELEEVRGIYTAYIKAPTGEVITRRVTSDGDDVFILADQHAEPVGGLING